MQKQHKQQVWVKLRETHPDLAKYEDLSQQYIRSSGQRKQQLCDSLHTLSVSITSNKELMTSLKQKLPKVSQNIQNRAHNLINKRVWAR